MLLVSIFISTYSYLKTQVYLLVIGSSPVSQSLAPSSLYIKLYHIPEMIVPKTFQNVIYLTRFE